MKSLFLTQFDDYLMSNEYSKASRESILKAVLQFENWMAAKNIENFGSVAYADMLNYMKHCTANNNSRKTIYLKLLFIRHFYNWLLKAGTISENPAANIRVRGIQRSRLYNILTQEELEQLYHNYRDASMAGKRNKVLLGLLIFQGLRSSEISYLYVQDIDLRTAQLKVASGRRKAGRNLEIHSIQMVDLIEYLKDIRNMILLKTGKVSDKVIVSMGSSDKLRNTIQYLGKQLKKQDGKIDSFKQIRSSVITHWLKQYDLRVVQYMAGHRYVSSTEKYKVNNLDGLIDDITKYHPL
jgi:integrase/recombinase XerD